MAIRQHFLVVGLTPADVPGGVQPTFSRGVAVKFDSADGSRHPANEYPADFVALPGASGIYFVRFTTPDGKADRRELMALKEAGFSPMTFGEGSRIEYLDNQNPPGAYAVTVTVVDHLWEAGLPGPCPCGLERCGQPEPRER